MNMERVSVSQSDGVRVGRLGLRELLEPRVRRIVADLLGTSQGSLRPEVSFAHDLGADMLDLTNVVVEVERRVGVRIAERTVDRIRVYQDLVDAVVQARLDPDGVVPRVFIRASVLPAGRDGHGAVTRSAWFSPYTAEILSADARRAGPGARLAITVPAGAPLAAARQVERCFARLGTIGVVVDVQHDRSHHRRAVA